MRKLLVILMLMCSVAAYAQQETDCFVVSKINVTGNNVTKMSTINREMLFHEGDTVCSEEAVKERDGKIDELRAKQEKLQKQIELLPPGLLEELEARERERRKAINAQKRKGIGGIAR